MYIRKVKRKCNVRACKNTDCFAISRSREVGNTIIICKDCLKAALERIGMTKSEQDNNVKVDKNTGIPSLFFNNEVNNEVSGKAEIESENKAENKAEIDDEVFICDNCGKSFDSVKGLQTHMRYCKSQNEE